MSFYSNHVFMALTVSCEIQQVQQAWLPCINMTSIFKSCGCRTVNELCAWSGSRLRAQRLSYVSTQPHSVNSAGATTPHSRLNSLAQQCPNYAPPSTIARTPVNGSQSDPLTGGEESLDTAGLAIG